MLYMQYPTGWTRKTKTFVAKVRLRFLVCLVKYTLRTAQLSSTTCSKSVAHGSAQFALDMPLNLPRKSGGGISFLPLR